MHIYFIIIDNLLAIDLTEFTHTDVVFHTDSLSLKYLIHYYWHLRFSVLLYVLTTVQISSVLYYIYFMARSHQKEICNRLTSDWLASDCLQTDKIQLGYIGITWFHSRQFCNQKPVRIHSEGNRLQFLLRYLPLYDRSL